MNKRRLLGRRLTWKRFLVVFCLALVLLVCLIGILLSGPIVPRTEQLVLPVDPSSAQLRADVEQLCRWSPRSHDRPEQLEATADLIATRFADAGLEVEVQGYDTTRGRFHNVIGLQKAARPTAGSFVIGAHYDTVETTPGADDNASGVAVLLELVRTLPQPAVQRDRYFVAFGTEEPPFFGTDEMGSYVFARSLGNREVDVDLMISLDMVGYYSDAPGSQSFPIKGLSWLYGDRGDFAAIIGNLGSGPTIRSVKAGMRATRSLPVQSFRGSPRFAPVDLSDHLSFWRLDMPAVQITDTAFMRFPYYHQAEDTPERLDYERMARLVTAIHGVLWDSSLGAQGNAD